MKREAWDMVRHHCADELLQLFLEPEDNKNHFVGRTTCINECRSKRNDQTRPTPLHESEAQSSYRPFDDGPFAD